MYCVLGGANKCVRSSRTRVTGRCEAPNMDAGNGTQVLWKSSKVFLTLEPSLQPYLFYFKLCVCMLVCVNAYICQYSGLEVQKRALDLPGAGVTIG